MSSNGFYDISDAEVVTQWETGVDIEARLRLSLLDDEYGFAGESEDNLVVLKDDLATKAGGTIRQHFAYQLRSAGKAKDAPLVNNEDRARTSTFDIKVDVLRNAVAVESPMFQQWVNFNLLETSKRLLGDWMATRMEFGLQAHAAGINIITADEYNLNNTIAAVQSKYIVRPNNKSAGGLTSGDHLTVDFVNAMLRRLNLLRPKIRPANTPFGPKYVMHIPTECIHDLRKSDSVWFQLMQAAIQGGEVDGNPIYNNLLGSVHDVLFYKSDLVAPGLNSAGTKIKSKTRRPWLGGAGALSLAFGRGDRPSGYGVNRFSWDMDSQDYGFRKMVACSTIVGAARPYFTDPRNSNVHENGVIVGEVFADYDTGLTDSDVYVDYIDAGLSVEA